MGRLAARHAAGARLRRRGRLLRARRAPRAAPPFPEAGALKSRRPVTAGPRALPGSLGLRRGLRGDVPRARALFAVARRGSAHYLVVAARAPGAAGLPRRRARAAVGFNDALPGHAPRARLHKNPEGRRRAVALVRRRRVELPQVHEREERARPRDGVAAGPLDRATRRRRRRDRAIQLRRLPDLRDRRLRRGPGLDPLSR
mmetsp:Transcript_17164/g.50458  ORF Transcript_17164/g.50458 Transcript_17164/m.50458 type:complete len:201 (-) Transcript_17164:362-964(-)